MSGNHFLEEALRKETERREKALKDNPICPLSMCSDQPKECFKEYCRAWRPEKTELVKGNPAYHGCEDKTLTYPEHCILMSHNEPLWPTIQKVLPGQE